MQRLLFLPLTLLLAASPATQPTLPPNTRSNLQYINDATPHHRLDLYLPTSPSPHPPISSPTPLILWIHGGGWTGGDKSPCPALPLVAKGYAVASINYRFSQEAIFPAQIQDCKAALRYLRAHAVEYNLDPTRVGVWGSSAGGHLVALLGLTPTTPDLNPPDSAPTDSFAVQAVVDWFGPTDLNTAGEKSTRSNLIGTDPKSHPQTAAKASPITYVSKDAPPFLIMHGDADTTVPPEQSQTLATALKAAGTDATLILVPHARHGVRGFLTPTNLKAVEDFFDKYLKPAPK